MGACKPNDEIEGRISVAAAPTLLLKMTRIEEGVQNDRSLLTLSRLREFASQLLHFRCGEEEEEIALFNKSLCNAQQRKERNPLNINEDQSRGGIGERRAF